MKIKNLFKKIARSFEKRRKRKNSILSINDNIETLNDLLIQESTKEIQRNHPNPFNIYGKKCFSQSDEDGITLEILKRIKKISNGSFLEIGVGDGTENNTLVLLSLGWNGIWVGGSNLAFDTSNSKRLRFFKNWVTAENIVEIIYNGLNTSKIKGLDLISVDLDGNDYFIVKKILEAKLLPSVFILEYNAKFPPPIKFSISYNPHHKWIVDDYFGASLSLWNQLMNQYGYILICCNSHTGANCFFVKKEFSKLFKEIPNDIEKIYSEPRYFLYKNFVHKRSIKLIQQIIND